MTVSGTTVSRPSGSTRTSIPSAIKRLMASVLAVASLTTAGALTDADTAHADPTGAWTMQTVPTGVGMLESVTYAAGTFVGVAKSGTSRVVTSSDGVAWEARTAGAANSWRSVTYGNGTFVAVSDDGTDRVMTSPDGINWTSRNVPAESWWEVIYANNLFVAVGTDKVMTSANGTTWTSQSNVPTGGWKSVAYGAGKYVAVGAASSRAVVMTSSNGSTWSLATVPTGVSPMESVTYGNGSFVAVGYDTDPTLKRVMTSSNGTTWLEFMPAPESGSPALDNSFRWNSVVPYFATFVAVGMQSTGGSVMTSNDATTWTQATISNAPYAEWQSVTVRDQMAVAVGHDSSLNPKIMTSGPSPAAAPGAPTIDSVTAGNGQLSIAFTTPGSDGGVAITAYEVSTDNGTSFAAASSTTSPIVVTGLTNGTAYSIKIRAVNSVGPGTASAAVSGTPQVPASGGGSSSGGGGSSSGGGTATGGSTPATPSASADSTTTTVSATTTQPTAGYANAVPGITVTDPKVYQIAPKEVSGNSAIIVLTPTQNKVLDVVSKTPSVCLPNDDDLVFLDEGKCIAEVVNAKTRKALRTLKTTVVEDDISEVQVGNEVAILTPLYFVAGTFDFKPESLARLAKLKNRITAAGSVLVAGHSGALMGNTPENVKLSEDRAKAAVEELRSRGAKGPFAIAGVGALDPATTVKTQEAQDKNRRVVIVLIP